MKSMSKDVEQKKGGPLESIIMHHQYLVLAPFASITVA